MAFLQPAGLLQAWVALDDVAIVGHVALGAPELAADQNAEVKRLFVGSTARGTGIAALLLETAAHHAQALGSLPILEVTTDGLVAIRLYERLGWRRTGTKIATWSDASGGHPLLYTYERTQ